MSHMGGEKSILGKGRQRMRWLYNSTNSMGLRLSKLPEIMKDRKVGITTVVGVSKIRTRLSD